MPVAIYGYMYLGMIEGHPKPLFWIGSSRKDVREFPTEVRRDIGQALYAAQLGDTDPAAKPLKGFGATTVMEIVDRHDTDTYRAVYTTELEGTIYMLHAFQKKSKRGTSTARRDISLIKKRLAIARQHHKGVGN
jgi:phage-related protein